MFKGRLPDQSPIAADPVLLIVPVLWKVLSPCRMAPCASFPRADWPGKCEAVGQATAGKTHPLQRRNLQRGLAGFRFQPPTHALIVYFAQHKTLFL